MVLLNGSALSINWAQQHAAAILEAWYPGEEGGTAIADTLLGRNNPSGRLPVTFYKSAERLPPFEGYGMKGLTYRYFTGDPLYPFGYGLSYTTFRYTAATLSTRLLQAGQTIEVSVDVKNTETVPGDEVAELYLLPVDCKASSQKALRGFQRVHLKAGEARTLAFQLTNRDMSFVDEKGERMVRAGDYRIFVGGGQPDTGLGGADTVLTIYGIHRLPL